jgi:hypothetical protein
MKNCLIMTVVLCCMSVTLHAQNRNVSENPPRITYFSASLGTYVFGNVRTGDVRAGSSGTQVRDIDASSGGAPASFTMDAALGYHITPAWAIEGALGFGFGGGGADTGYEESQTFYGNNGYGPPENFSAHDKLSWGGAFVSFDLGVSYNLWASKKPSAPFYINGKLGLGYFNYFKGNAQAGNMDHAGGLRYSAIVDWYGGKNPGAKYAETYLLSLAEDFFLKPGFDFGVKFGYWRVMLNTHAKIFPQAIGNERIAFINDGNRQRSVKLTLPTWIIPNITLGMQYYF